MAKTNDKPAAGKSPRRSDRLGSAFTWLSGGALAFNILMIVGLLALLAWQGMGYFWPKTISEVRVKDGSVYWGQLVEHETARLISEEAGGKVVVKQRRKLKVGNKRQFEPFKWLDEDQIVETETPEDLVLLERTEWGNFYGRLLELRDDKGQTLAAGEEAWIRIQTMLEEKEKIREQIQDLEDGELADISYELAKLRLHERWVDLPDNSMAQAEKEKERASILKKRGELQENSLAGSKRVSALRAELEKERALLATSTGENQEIIVGHVLRALRPNTMSLGTRIGLYLSRIWELVWDSPRESNTEGGIFPAIFGTVMMVFLMTCVVTPFGVLAALYLREYSKGGPFVRMVRIAVNNLAGVPSIVFGVFGLGFFVYLIGGSIDSLFYPEALPEATFGTGGILWASLTLALLTVPVVIVATEEGLDAVPRIVREGSLALGATKFETTYKVVLPSAAPGILTGVILAIARAAGEVAPLMIVGMVKMADTLPVDGHFPFLHVERKFMHLGFHIFDVGFQSPDVEATIPLVYATALLLVVLVTAMNLVAILIRNHLRKKYATSAV